MRNLKSILKITRHLVILAPFLVSFANFNTAFSSSLPPAVPQLGSPAQGEEGLSTPDLIQLAFARGEITEEERLLYLAYALGDLEKLPTRFHSNYPWSGTFVIMDLREAVSSKSVMCKLSPFVQSELRRIL